MNPVLESGTFSGSGIICELFVSDPARLKEKIYKKRKDIFKKKRRYIKKFINNFRPEGSGLYNSMN